MNALEEGTAAAIDFEKIRRAAKSPQGLIPVVLQNAESRDVLFVGYANDQALRETLTSGRAVLWSASRDELWRKGATSGDELELVDVRVNCEQNALLYLVRPVSGGVCHTTDAHGAARKTCFYRRVGDPASLEFIEGFAEVSEGVGEPRP
jgi:phosphoribosyl-AMP cyclohydrolase